MARGIVLNRLKDSDESEKAYAKALEMAPKEPIISREVGIFYFKSGNRSKAFQYLHMAAIKTKRTLWHFSISLEYRKKPTNIPAPKPTCEKCSNWSRKTGKSINISA